MSDRCRISSGRGSRSRDRSKRCSSRSSDSSYSRSRDSRNSRSRDSRNSRRSSSDSRRSSRNSSDRSRRSSRVTVQKRLELIEVVELHGKS